MQFIQWLFDLFKEPESQEDTHMELSRNFTLAEMLKSSTAIRLNIDNEPGEGEIDAMIALAENVMQPVRDEFGSMRVNSGFRCLQLNRILNSRDTSQHVNGEAVDFEKIGVSNYELACWIRDNLDFDQLILEFWYEEDDNERNPLGDLNMGWVHVSYKDDGTNRNKVLTINKNGTFYGLGY